MNVDKFRVLVVEDNDSMRIGMQKTLEKAGCSVKAVSCGADAIYAYKNSPFDFVITDLRLGDINGVDVLKRLKELDPDALVMIVTAFGNIETAVDAMKHGAFDFITKPFSTDHLKIKLQKAKQFAKMSAEHRRLVQENLYLREENRPYPEIIGESEKIKDIYEKIRKVSAIDSSVLITGESGTGKDLVARAIHYHSPRRHAPFVKVNCSALAEGVLESELFGHERGAFTGATSRKYGRFEIADKGTIFLDEIGDISPSIQLKLLRVLQEKAFERVGGTETIHVDVRIIAATNQDLTHKVSTGSFREDLYYRLHIIPISMPPLRERKSDIPLLVKHFMSKLRKKISKQVLSISEEALEILKSYSWPGNIRELENIIEQAYVFCDGDTITSKDIPSSIVSETTQNDIDSDNGKLNEVLEKIEREMILKAYLENNKIKTKTAKQLGIKPSALYYKLEKYGIS